MRFHYDEFRLAFFSPPSDLRFVLQRNVVSKNYSSQQARVESDRFLLTSNHNYANFLFSAPFLTLAPKKIGFRIVNIQGHGVPIYDFKKRGTSVAYCRWYTSVMLSLRTRPPS